jgi:quinol monooxygenase YgiN
MLRFELHMEFAPHQCDQSAAVLRSLVGPVRSEPGCHATRFLRSDGEPTKMTWVEEWRTEDDFERRLRSQTFRRLLAVIELAVNKPVVEIDRVAWRRQFDLVEEMLGRVNTQAAEFTER